MLAGKAAPAVGPEAAVPPRGWAEAELLELRAPFDIAAALAAVEVPEAPAPPEAASEGDKTAVPASEAPEPEPRGWQEAVYRPWGPWAAHIPGTARSDCSPAASSHCWTADRVSSAEAVVLAWEAAADTGEVPSAVPADTAAGIAAGRRPEAPGPGAAVRSASVPSEGPEAPAEMGTAVEVPEEPVGSVAPGSPSSVGPRQAAGFPAEGPAAGNWGSG